MLYGEGDKLARDRAYSAAMEKVYRDYPDDLEAAAFYSLSLLGTVRPGDKSYRDRRGPARLPMKFIEKNPNHPGAAHYIIHAFDDPDHAILALARRAALCRNRPRGASRAAHACRTSFCNLGMWPEAAASNESAWAVV